ncbi:MAG: putative manganese-dependent inorganic diphosphatase [Eubacteriaceae bacterium]|jgi:manganese-dependent inorganic pyrophosphatase|nr:putative manganese-dependent inorganic diphosphatase [Eubacteriaceae bacterium]
MSSKNEPIYIFGHQNPDTDSICSAIAYAYLKQQQGLHAVAYRIGKINRETAFVLDYFNFSEPEYLSTVKPQVMNLDMDEATSVNVKTSLAQAMQLLEPTSIDTLPVVDNKEMLIGLISTSDIAKLYMDVFQKNILSIRFAPFKNIVETLQATVLFDTKKIPFTPNKVFVADVSTKQLEYYLEPGDIVILGNCAHTQQRAIELGASCIILTLQTKVEKNILTLAKQYCCRIIQTPFDTFTTARLILLSIPASLAMTKEVFSFEQDDYLDTVREKMQQHRYKNFPVLDTSGHFKGFISRYHLINFQRKKIILIDHSDQSQSIAGIKEADIIEIIDHHRIGDIQTAYPIFYRNEPVGSTATIITELFEENAVPIPKDIAGILCAAILSDTVAFRSPTCTHVDVQTANKLAAIAQIECESFAQEMFMAGSPLKNMTPAEIMHSDFKEYQLNRKKIGIGQINMVGLSEIRKIKPALINYLESLVEDKKYYIVMLILTDIINEETEVLFSESPKGLVAKGFNPLKDEHTFAVNGIVSRKKQIVPKITELLARANQL